MKCLPFSLLQIPVLLISVFVFGCARPLPPDTVLSFRDTGQLLAQLDAVSNRFQSLQSSVKVEVVTGSEAFVASQLLYVQLPAKLRSEILFGPFATPVMSFSADQDQITVYQPLQGTFSQGDASVANIARFTRMPLRVEDLVGMILVSPPRFPFERSAVSRVANNDRLDLIAAGGVEQHFTFDADGNLLQAVYLLGERLQLQADYCEFEPPQGGFPRKLQVSMPERQVVATMIFRDSVVNVPIPENKFTIKLPADIKIQKLP